MDHGELRPGDIAEGLMRDEVQHVKAALDHAELPPSLAFDQSDIRGAIYRTPDDRRRREKTNRQIALVLACRRLNAGRSAAAKDQPIYISLLT